jgi:hypothetical protein
MGGLLFGVWALLGLPATATAARTDGCLNHCTLEKNAAGELESLCVCSEKKFTVQADNIFALRSHSAARYRQELEKRLSGATPAEKAAVAANSCAAAAGADRPANELRLLAGLAERPLCECVGARVFFPVRRECKVTPAGVTLCHFELERAVSSRVGPVRAPTLYDYQACIAARANYKRPETCKAVRCTDQPRACGSGTELVNVADTESCCPIFECRKGGES